MVIAIACVIAGVMVFLQAKSAIHEILASQFLVAFAVLVAGSSVAREVALLRRDLWRK